MRRPWARTLIVAAALLAGIAAHLRAPSEQEAPPAPPRPTPPAALPPAESAAAAALARFHCGVCWVGRADDASMEYLRARGADWISVTPFGYGQEDAGAPPTNGFQHSRFRGESIDGIRDVVRAARRAEMQTLLKPHLWFHTRDGKWLGDIAMESERDWERWFRMYWDFLRPFVEMARDEEVALLAVGTELGGTVAREREWRALIARVRATYGGALTYAANWDREYEAVPFWDALDAVGVQAYFPLAREANASLESLADAWRPWTEKLAAHSARAGLPVLFTELGYRPVADAAVRPWEWSGGEPDVAAQERGFAAARRALAECKWLRGVYVWKWFVPYNGVAPGAAAPRHPHDGFSPQGRPAERTIFEWFEEKKRGGSG
ncbi:MAG: hypothetical protein L0Z55_10065 [Planctomycetes bacterium]|nr:hypothetical protein [Planctomycetota bacterium]